jgi:ApaG protein
MINTITEGVKVSVETIYQPDIENVGNHAVQLMRRHWHIFDSNGTLREVEGEGVVGLQPIIEPGQSHEYVSGCNLKTDMGSMKGEYQMLRLVDEVLFDVAIPEFYLIAPYKLN